MDEQAEKSSPENDDSKLENGEKKNEDLTFDPETFSCMLQPSPADSDSDPNYIGIRRLLLYRKAQSGVLRRKVLLEFVYEYSCIHVRVYYKYYL